MHDQIDFIKKLMRPLKSRIALMISRSVVAIVNDSEKIQSLQALVLAGEVQADIERFQNFGFTSTPLPNAEAVLVYPGGEREHAIAVAVDDANFRPTGQPPGSSTQYDAFGGKSSLIAGNHKVEALVKSEILAPTVLLGSGSMTEKILNGETFQMTYNAHTHLAFGVPTTTPVIPSLPTDLSLAVKAAKLPV